MRKNSAYAQGIVHITPLVVLAILFVVAASLQSNQKGNEIPEPSRNTTGMVLKSEDDSTGTNNSESDSENSGSSNSEDSDNDSSGSSNSGSSQSNDREGDKNNSDNNNSGSINKNESPSSSSGRGSSNTQDIDERTETRLPSNVRVKTRQEEGKERVDIYEGAKKLRIETRDGKTIVKVENEDGEETAEDELETGEELELGATEGAELRVRTQFNKFIIAHGLVEAETRFPLSVNPETRELTVTTPAGSKVVTILPQQAVDNMLANNVIDRIISSLSAPTPSPIEGIATSEAEPLEGQSIELEEENGELVYTIEGQKQERLLGFFGVLIPKRVRVSAQTGELLGIEQSLLSRILDILSS